MASRNHDTDPQDPRALGASSVTTEPERITPGRILAVAAVEDTDPGHFAPKKASTDPGVAPPSVPGKPPNQPLGLVVPAPNMRPADVSPPPAPAMRIPTPAKYDTIETLLDGIPGTRGERVKTTRESSGESAAAYHGQHSLRAPHETPPPEPSVVAEGGTPETEVRRREELITARRRRGNEPTVVLPKTQGSRVVIALFSGVLVVLAIFMGLRIWVSNEKVKAAAANPALTQVIPSNVSLPPRDMPTIPPPPDLSELATAAPPLTSPPPTTITGAPPRPTAPSAPGPSEGSAPPRATSSGPPPPGFDALKQHY